MLKEGNNNDKSRIVSNTTQKHRENQWTKNWLFENFTETDKPLVRLNRKRKTKKLEVLGIQRGHNYLSYVHSNDNEGVLWTQYQ